MKDSYQVVLRPVISGLRTALKEKNREVCFEIDPRANKTEVKKAVEKLFKVKVEHVRVVTMKGKYRRVGKNVGQTKAWKKAYVKLREGEKMIEFFEAV